jgi:hypothetical protein
MIIGSTVVSDGPKKKKIKKKVKVGWPVFYHSPWENFDPQGEVGTRGELWSLGVCKAGP